MFVQARSDSTKEEIKTQQEIDESKKEAVWCSHFKRMEEEIKEYMWRNEDKRSNMLCYICVDQQRQWTDLLRTGKNDLYKSSCTNESLFPKTACPPLSERIGPACLVSRPCVITSELLSQ